MCKKFADLHDILKLKWLPIAERQEYHLAKSAYQAVNSEQWPEHLRLEQHLPSWTLRSSSEPCPQFQALIITMHHGYLTLYPQQLDLVGTEINSIAHARHTLHLWLQTGYDHVFCGFIFSPSHFDHSFFCHF